MKPASEVEIAFPNLPTDDLVAVPRGMIADSVYVEAIVRARREGAEDMRERAAQAINLAELTSSFTQEREWARKLYPRARAAIRSLPLEKE